MDAGEYAPAHRRGSDLLIAAIGAHTIRMIPPLIVTKADCDQAVAIIRDTVASLGE